MLAVLGATLLDEQLWHGAFVGGIIAIAAVALELTASTRRMRTTSGSDVL